MKMTLSVVVAVRNEEKNIERCLAAIKNIASEIVVYDESSTDRTVALAKKFTKKVFIVAHEPIFHVTKQKAIDAATSDWILQLDADEVATPNLCREIIKTIASDPVENGFWIPRPNFLLGRFLRKGGAYPDYTLRLYRRGTGHLPCRSVHEQAEVNGKTGYLKRDLLHYAYPTFFRYIEHFNRYTDLWAQTVKGGFWTNFFWKPLFDQNQGFISIYFRHLGFLDGFPGFIWALFSALNFPVAYLKSVEKKYGDLARGGI